jgi:HAD superfamily hydrolase (TIGR01490 family)
MTIAFFDFDGTITRKDTLFQFIKFSKGTLKFYFGLFFLSPILIAFKLGIIPNWRAKELLFSFYFKGMSETNALKLGQEFSKQIIPGLLREKATQQIEFHKNLETKIVVVTASFSFWIKLWCDLNQFDLIATEYEGSEGRLTGFIKGKNCHGAEKVRRINEKYDLRKFDKIYAYGDSRADLEMLNLADIKYLKWKIIE